MKKIFLLSAGILLFISVSRSMVPQIIVSGAGSGIVDGNYPLSEFTPGGKVSYMRGDGYTIMWESDRWILINGPGTLRYYYNTNNTTLPPAGGWQIDVDGDIFAPTLSGDVDPLPVELISFTGIAKGKVVELAWQTATEVNNHGFEVERRTSESGTWSKIGFVAGNGNSNSPKSYRYVDATANPKGAGGKVVYRLKQIDNDGQFEYHGMVEVNASRAVTKFALAQNFPNPFNPETKISFAIPVSGFVSLKVYDILGKEVASLVNGVQEAGPQEATFIASNYPSGMYFYTLRSGSFVETKKMLMIK